MKTTMSRYWSQIARDLLPYVPGEQPQIPNLIKLNTNESPFGPSPLAIQAMRSAISNDLRLYPDPEANELREVLADHHGLERGQVFVGNGSDEVLAHAFVALLKQPEPLLFADVTYNFYPVWAQLYGIDWQTIPLDDDLRIRVADYHREAGSIVIANPNAPTGIALERQDIVRLLENHPDIPVVIDEAYVDFGAESSVTLIEDYPNLLIVQTMSKSRALAGLRVGYALGSAELIEALRRVRDSFNSYPLGYLAQVGAIASVRDDDYFRERCGQVAAEREAMIEQLSELGFVIPPSEANFVFARHPALSGSELSSALRARAVLVRHFEGPRTAPYVRITVGTENDTEQLIKAIESCLEAA
jgi:histidinol-phosphate aminotransferase